MKIDEREEFAIKLLIAREASGVQTLRLSLPERLCYSRRPANGEMICGFSIEYGPKLYLGNAWSDSGIMALHRLAKRVFATHPPISYVLHSRPELTPLWKRLGFVETGKTVKHKEVLINGQPLIAVEMVKE